MGSRKFGDGSLVKSSRMLSKFFAVVRESAGILNEAIHFPVRKKKYFCWKLTEHSVLENLTPNFALYNEFSGRQFFREWVFRKLVRNVF